MPTAKSTLSVQSASRFPWRGIRISSENLKIKNSSIQIFGKRLHSQNRSMSVQLVWRRIRRGGPVRIADNPSSSCFLISFLEFHSQLRFPPVSSLFNHQTQIIKIVERPSQLETVELTGTTKPNVGHVRSSDSRCHCRIGRSFA